MAKATGTAGSSRARILKAASELAAESGPGNLSLDAVAARAGLSKGGLLYNFPTKAKLLEAVVEDHLARFEGELVEATDARAGEPNALALAYLTLARRKENFKESPPAGLLAAMAEDPGFLAPVKRFNRALLDRIEAATRNKDAALIAFLAIEGIRSTQLLGLDVLTEKERDAALDGLIRLLA